MLDRLIGVEEKIFQGLEIPYRIVDTCTGDLGGPAYRKFDIEAWMPGRGDKGEWGEITSASNCTDYQARRLGIRYKEQGGKNPFVHTLNGSALAWAERSASVWAWEWLRAWLRRQIGRQRHQRSAGAFGQDR